MGAANFGIAVIAWQLVMLVVRVEAMDRLVVLGQYGRKLVKQLPAPEGDVANDLTIGLPPRYLWHSC